MNQAVTAHKINSLMTRYIDTRKIKTLSSTADANDLQFQGHIRHPYDSSYTNI